MATEIEYKFLIKNIPDVRDCSRIHISQGYLINSQTPELVLRVRASKFGDESDASHSGFITVKGNSTSNASRDEFEMQIPYQFALTLLSHCEKVLSKTRYHLHNGKHTWELDQFHGNLEGMWIAEVELNAEDESFEKPNWVGEDVTYVKEFFNSHLINLVTTPNVYKELMEKQNGS